jgi:hypothetical protein
MAMNIEETGWPLSKSICEFFKCTFTFYEKSAYGINPVVRLTAFIHLLGAVTSMSWLDGPTTANNFPFHCTNSHLGPEGFDIARPS